MTSQNVSPFPEHRQCHPAGPGGPSSLRCPLRGHGHPLRARGAPRSPAHPAAARTVVKNRLICCSFSFSRTSQDRETVGLQSWPPPCSFPKEKKNTLFIRDLSEIKLHKQNGGIGQSFSFRRRVGLFDQRQTERSVVKHLYTSALWLRKSVSLLFCFYSEEE